MQVVAAARAVHIQRFAQNVQAVKEAGGHCPGINFIQLNAAAGDLRIFEALRAGALHFVYVFLFTFRKKQKNKDSTILIAISRSR